MKKMKLVFIKLKIKFYNFIINLPSVRKGQSDLDYIKALNLAIEPKLFLPLKTQRPPIVQISCNRNTLVEFCTYIRVLSLTLRKCQLLTSQHVSGGFSRHDAYSFFLSEEGKHIEPIESVCSLIVAVGEYSKVVGELKKETTPNYDRTLNLLKTPNKAIRDLLTQLIELELILD